ncbi:hypothetical protein ACWC2M_32790 [Streptomyces sp. NPDC001761]
MRAVDMPVAAVDVVAVMYVMPGAFKPHHLLTRARRHRCYLLRGHPHPAGPVEQIVRTVIDDYVRPAGGC